MVDFDDVFQKISLTLDENKPKFVGKQAQSVHIFLLKTTQTTQNELA